MATTGNATLDFGASPGKTDASVTITGQAAIVSGSFVEAWIRVPVGGTANHTMDECWVENITVRAGNISAGTGFTIYGKCNLGNAVGQFSIDWVWT